MLTMAIGGFSLNRNLFSPKSLESAVSLSVLAVSSLELSITESNLLF